MFVHLCHVVAKCEIKFEKNEKMIELVEDLENYPPIDSERFNRLISQYIQTLSDVCHHHQATTIDHLNRVQLTINTLEEQGTGVLSLEFFLTQ